jgi:hypothetical protein
VAKIFFICLFFLFFSVFMVIPIVSAAHYLVGIVNDARDGTFANDHTVVVWNTALGINDNQTDIIGQSGNSGTDNVYMIDCELLNNPCKIGDVLNLRVFNNGDNHFSSNISVTVSGAGYDIATNMTLSSIFNITTISVDDDILDPINQIDLFAATNRTVTCRAIIEDFDGIGIKNATAKFFDNFSSSYSDLDNGNKHYSNDSCYINSSYEINQSEVLCDFQIAYYANSSYWNCTISPIDNNNVSRNGSGSSFINPLLSIEVNDSLTFNGVSNAVSSEQILNVTNYGNVKINLSLYGYARNEGDGYAMNCSDGKNISIMYEKYNLTATNSGNLNLLDFQIKYINLTSSSVVKRFNLDFRHSDGQNIATNSTYWRIYGPGGISGTCSGNIVFGASQAPGS